MITYTFTCDKCGEEYERDSNYGRIINLYTTNGVIITPDLCPSCRVKVREFVIPMLKNVYKEM